MNDDPLTADLTPPETPLLETDFPPSGELPYYSQSDLVQAPLSNGQMFGQSDAVNTTVGRLQSQDGRSALDLDKGYIELSDSVNKRLRMGNDS